jgi:PST family polysaccharide transporter
MQLLKARRVATNFSLLAVGEVISKAFTFVAFVYLARQLGPAIFGTVEFALAVSLVFTRVVDGGFSLYGTREVAKNPGGVSRLASQVVAVQGVLALGGFTLLLGLVALIKAPWSVKQLVLLYGLTIFLTPLLVPWVFQGLDRMGVVAATTTIRWMTFAGGILLWIRGSEGAWRVPVVEVGALTCAAAFSLWMYRRSFGPIRPRLEPGASLALFRDALPIGMSQLLWVVRLYFATILLGLAVGGEPVGWFSAALRIVLAVNIFGVLYLYSLLPTLSRVAKEPREALQDIMLTSIPLVAWATVFVGAAGTAFAEPVIAAVYGAQYAEGAASLSILIWLVPLALLTGHFRYTLVAHDAQRLDLRCTALGAGTCVVLALILVPTHGPVGAAAAILASELVTWFVAYLFVRRRVVAIPVGRHLTRPLLAGALMVVLVRAVPSPSLWVGGTAGVLLYASALVMLGPKMLPDIRSVFARSSP